MAYIRAFLPENPVIQKKVLQNVTFFSMGPEKLSLFKLSKCQSFCSYNVGLL